MHLQKVISSKKSSSTKAAPENTPTDKETPAKAPTKPEVESPSNNQPAESGKAGVPQAAPVSPTGKKIPPPPSPRSASGKPIPPPPGKGGRGHIKSERGAPPYRPRPDGKGAEGGQNRPTTRRPSSGGADRPARGAGFPSGPLAQLQPSPGLGDQGPPRRSSSTASEKKKSRRRRRQEELQPMDAPAYTPEDAPVPEGEVVIERASSPN